KVFDRSYLPSVTERIELFTSSLSRLTTAGYENIGLDHFALPDDGLSQARRKGSLHRNFMGYSTHKTSALLGFGLSAISSLPSAFGQNSKTMREYSAHINGKKFPVDRGV